MVPGTGADLTDFAPKSTTALLAGVFLLAALAVLLRDGIVGDPFPLWTLAGCAAIIALALVPLSLLPGTAKTQVALLQGTVVVAMAVFLGTRDHHAIALALGAGDAAAALSLWNRTMLHFVLLITAYTLLVIHTPLRALVVTAPLAAIPLVIGYRTGVVTEVGPLAEAGVLMAIGLLLGVVGAAVIGFIFRGLAQKTTESQYELLEKLGVGGMGEVWLAQHKMLARPAAMKLIKPEILGAGDAKDASRVMRRFEREARATAALRSPNTVEIYDFGITKDGTFYYVMEYLDGFDLETLVSEHGPVGAGRAIYLLSQACDSLADAHDNKLVHRDIKPANLYVSRMGAHYDFVKVLDFGLVKPEVVSPDEPKLSIDDQFTGTPAYMPPELAIGDNGIDARSDLYALGCVAYWLLTGHLVFDAPSPLKMVVAHATLTPEAPSARTELDVPEELDRIVLKCLAKEPADRYQSALELAAALRACASASTWNNAAAKRWWISHRPVAAAA